MNDILPPPTPIVPTPSTTTSTIEAPSPPPSLTTVKHASRFTEHFDIVLPPAAFESFLLGTETQTPPPASQQQQQQQRSMSISTSRPSVFAKPVRMHSSPAITTSSSFTNDQQQQAFANTTTSPEVMHHSMNHIQNDAIINNSTSTSSHSNSPMSPPPPPSAAVPTSTSSTQPVSKQQQSIALLYKDYASNTNCLNRADMMIKRLGNWLVFLKLAAGWLVEIQKMTASSAFKRLKKEHPERYDQINKKRKECQTNVSNFKKECRDKIHALKINPALQMEELLLRANETRKRMAHLSKLCDQADDPKRPHLPELDPWLANLQVLRYLKRETTEENRLRELMVPIQQDMKDLELKLTEAFDTMVAFCVEQETTVTQYGTTLDQVLGHFLPQHTWQAFVAAQQYTKEWVDEDHIKKNYLQINYPNKQHSHVATVKKGVLGRRSGVLKHYHDKYFVLTHYGYLHQFKLEDKIKPEASIYVTSTTIQPEANDDDALFDEQHMADEMETNMSSNANGGGGHTFDIKQQKRKTYHFKTTSGSELVSWCRALTNVANGSSVDKLLIQRKQKLQQQQQRLLSSPSPSSKIHHHHHHDRHDMNSNSSITSSMTASPHQPTPSSMQVDHDDNDDEEDDDSMSQFHSIHSNHDDNDSSSSSSGSFDHHRSPLAESDLLSLDIGHVDHHQPHGSSSSSLSFDHQQQQPATTTTNTVLDLPSSPPAALEDESGIYFSSTSTPNSSSPPMPRRAVPTYQANLNLMVAQPTPPS